MLSPDEVAGYVLLDLALILAAARLVGGVFVRFRQPRVVGEIIAGLLLGPTLVGGELATGGEPGSGLVNQIFPGQAFSFLEALSTVALVFFMFLVGLEVEQRYFRGHEKQIAVLGLAVTVVPFLIGFGVARVLDEPGKWRLANFTTHALFIGAGLAVTAFPVLARILQEKRMLDTDMGAVAIGAAALSLPLMFAVVAGAHASTARGVVDDVALKILLAVVLVGVLFLVVRPALAWLVARRFQPGEPLEGDLFALLLIGALACGLAADRIGINALNGGFLFGAAVPQVPGLGRAVVDRMQHLVVVLFLPVLLAVAGLETNLRVVDADEFLGLALFLAALVASKWLVSLPVGRAVGLSWREASTVGVLMNCRGLEILVVALIGKQAGVLSPELMCAFVIGAIVTTLMTGPLFDLFVEDRRVEAERDRMLAASLAEAGERAGGPRTLVVAGKPSFGAVAVEEAGRLLGGGNAPSPRYLVAEPVPTQSDGEYGGPRVADRADLVREVLVWAEPVADQLGELGAEADAVAFPTPDREGDLVRLAQIWGSNEAICGLPEDAEALEKAGLRVHRIGAAEAVLPVAVA